MRKAIIIFTALACLVVVGQAQASAWNRTCQGGFTFGSQSQWATSRLWVGMSYPTARSIALRTPVQEFGTYVKAGDEPCMVAQTVTLDAGNAWYNWPGNDGWVNVPYVFGYSSGPSLGRFYCTGVGLTDGGANETCKHRADGHAGPITVRFTIS